MCECVVKFSDPMEIRDFVTLATRQAFPIRVEHGGLTTSATSIMSLFCRGLNRPLRVFSTASGDDAARFLEALAPYLVAG